MGYLWANMEKIDVQGTYEALTQAKEALTVAENRAENAENRVRDAGAENARLKALLAAHGIEMPES